MARSVAAGALLLASAVGAAGAQAPVSTGVNVIGGVDQSYRVSLNGGAFSNAFVVTNPPIPPWQSNVPGSYQWISVTPSASPGLSGGTVNTYVYQLQFTLSGIDATTAVMQFMCTSDNTFIGYSLNGGASHTGCGDQSTSYQFGPMQILSGFQSGLNTLQFTVTGDGTTDGLLVNIASFTGTAVTVTPEPATVSLLATGLVGVFGLGLRRKKVA